MSKAKKTTSITSRQAGASKRSRATPRGRSQKVGITQVEERGGMVFFKGDLIGRSTQELAAEMADPLAKAIAAAKARAGVDVVVYTDESEGAQYVVESKYSPRPHSARPTTEELAERMLPDSPVPSPAQAALAQRESQARWSMLEEFGAFTSEELADQRSQAKNRHALANRWRSEGKVFAVDLRGRRLFPGFQFDPETYAPEPIVADVLDALPREQMSEWEVALWWTASDPWLEGKRPVDVMQEDPDAVIAAAGGLAEDSPL